ncbi:MAG: outer membrane protein transport protein [Bacteroidales bacterium]|nr:outer membrane protein transport protein [Bacteroidales bacterium]
MKRITLLLVAILSLPFFSFSGGIVHNTNQSASWVRMFARDASTDIDAVFYNPAGLTKLGEGFFISLNSQTLFQNREINSDYQYLNNSPVDYEGSVTVPVMPSVYASYNTGKFAFSLGVNIIGGGGSAEFGNGLPSFEMAVADLYPAFAAQGVTGYNMKGYLEGSSLFWGIQAGVSYEINDMISVYLGGRYVTAKNTYEGYLKDITVDLGGTTIPASTFVSGVSDQLDATSATIAGAISGGFIVADDAFADPVGIATLTGLGLYQAGMTNAQAAQAFGMGAIGMDQKATILEDQTADIEQTGTGITPIIGVNISPNDKFNIGLKYEFRTKIELENNVDDGKGFLYSYDGLTPLYKYPDGEINRNDMPALLTIGVDYKITEKFLASTGLHYYFDKAADYGKKVGGVHMDNEQIIDENYWEWALGLQYNVNDKLLVSAGYLRAQSGVSEEFQTDIDYKISSNTYGAGGAYSITPMIDVNLAIAYTKYVEDTKSFDYAVAGSPANIENVTETYNRDNFFIAIGLDFKFGKKSE